ncbi:Predicted NAD/FAD-binding protein [Salinihabitans flavidus]|uniref:Predicted NAD/FAD-binding protein n=1 Tax=Salinihabitans flavidus TaxID=569882 RepID=A0A1H8MNZ7_9RHOB|nr:FAD-dependent oxidoreductase [Salinihabitans flavidus]SEO19171.1 Predicted NAD/FAD-binding protein [Salinihabitans flavidus]
MSFDAAPVRPRHIAIVGAGISGLAAAYLLAPHHRVTLIEAAPRLGGHARTVMAGKRGDQPVDTGFIVFNYPTYPHLTAMFDDLQVPVETSNMSFGASIDNGRVEYALFSLNAVMGQRRNIARPQFYGLLRDILRFNTRAVAASDDPALTIGDLLDNLSLGAWFRNYYLLPICGAIWSTPPDGILDFPARSLVQFFRNHALLGWSDQHQWWTVSGGSVEYVRRLEARLRLLGADIRTASPVRGVERRADGVTVHLQGQPAIEADEVIMATHSDDALRLLDRPTAREESVLGDLRYQDNQAILHRDPNQMPRRRACWSSWVYRADHSRPQSAIGVTYWMNRLQNIPEDDPHFVTLNPIDPVPDHLIYDQTTFRHPVFDHAAIAAQGRLAAMQGDNRTWFAGAYTRHGFHEDGFASAVSIAEAMAATHPVMQAAE